MQPVDCLRDSDLNPLAESAFASGVHRLEDRELNEIRQGIFPWQGCQLGYFASCTYFRNTLALAIYN